MRFVTKTPQKVNLGRSIYAAKPDIVKVLETSFLSNSDDSMAQIMRWKGVGKWWV
ncbi:hypothetical protein [Neobacillus drentensis]|uniref:hypothetical protein n=1 Tax=Neobacillus drentensis TaxID=220684 RepID=UPI0030006E64